MNKHDTVIGYIEYLDCNGCVWERIPYDAYSLSFANGYLCDEHMPNSTVCCLRPLRTKAHRARKSTLCSRQRMYPSSTASMSSLDIPYPRRFRLTEKTQNPAARRPIRC